MFDEPYPQLPCNVTSFMTTSPRNASASMPNSQGFPSIKGEVSSFSFSQSTILSDGREVIPGNPIAIKPTARGDLLETLSFQ